MTIHRKSDLDGWHLLYCTLIGQKDKIELCLTAALVFSSMYLLRVTSSATGLVDDYCYNIYIYIFGMQIETVVVVLKY